MTFAKITKKFVLQDWPHLKHMWRMGQLNKK